MVIEIVLRSLLKNEREKVVARVMDAGQGRRHNAAGCCRWLMKKRGGEKELKWER